VPAELRARLRLPGRESTSVPFARYLLLVPAIDERAEFVRSAQRLRIWVSPVILNPHEGNLP
jgi:hypothetical protein